MGAAFQHCRRDRARYARADRTFIRADRTFTRADRTFIRADRTYCSAHAQRHAHSFLTAK
jgi:hypothetical protein